MTDEETLRVEGVGERVFAVGDCTAVSGNRLVDVYSGVAVLIHNLRNDLLVCERRGRSLCGLGREEMERSFVDRKVEGRGGKKIILPVTRWGGLGVWEGWRIPGWLVWCLKGRDFGLGRGERAVKGIPYDQRVYHVAF